MDRNTILEIANKDLRNTLTLQEKIYLIERYCLQHNKPYMEVAMFVISLHDYKVLIEFCFYQALCYYKRLYGIFELKAPIIEDGFKALKVVHVF